MVNKLVITLAAIACTFVAANAVAQDGVSLRGVYQGTFLPEATEIVVLQRAVGIEQDGRAQPEFMARDAYPREAELVYGRDLLTGNGFSSRLYGPTDQVDRLYFLYALTPDSTVYWSYSAERDSLKFDVVNTGVMSVAPIFSSEVREDVVRRFFHRRVLVQMPDHDDGPGSVDRPASDSLDIATATAAVAESTAVTSSEPSSGPHVASATPPSRRPASNPYLSFGIPVLLVFGLITMASVVSARKQRNEARQLRQKLASVDRPREVDPADSVGHELDELRRSQRDLRRENSALRERCADLEQELSARSERGSW